ncbi:class A beta-lactamase [Rhizomicrobium electricum]|uniref:Beta-lactamase n=1 Tax=Rhizomicrobium electricum TaxID=480070 RepID=A0ABP3PHN3_9PROT|nr:class A beta-lactamase [Rhizomicrobium electricum]NIJ48485.1 beta-lactamase class A [Rhizomicrobium electricum]
MLTRRAVMTGVAAVVASPARAEDSLGQLDTGGRLGVSVLDTGSGKRLRHRATERFAMCSTFKLLLAAAVLKRIDTGKEDASRVIAYSKADHLVWSPVTEKHTALPVTDLVDAIVQVSDNTAANLLLDTIGGPAGWTAFVRGFGDKTSRLDRTELTLNNADPGDPRDTTTPDAMLENLQKVLLGDVLTPASRQHLIDTMARSITRIKRLKAGLPKDWRIADKTGTGKHDTYNDVAIIYPPGRAPILACAYYTEATRPDPENTLAEVGRAIAAM